MRSNFLIIPFLLLFGCKTVVNHNVTFKIENQPETVVVVKHNEYLKEKNIPNTDIANKIFLGWYEEDVLIDFSTMRITRDVIVEASYEGVYIPKQFKVTLHYNNGTENEIFDTYGEDHRFNKPVNPVYSGYQFLGWYYEPEFTQSVIWVDSEYVVLLSNTNLYAKWAN